MKGFKLEVVKYLTDDVIATSGLCTMSGDSYFLNFDACGYWWIEKDLIDNPNGSDFFSYYDEYGTYHENVEMPNANWPDGDEAFTGNAMWFHHIDGNFYLCDNKNHHHTYTIID